MTQMLSHFFDFTHAVKVEIFYLFLSLNYSVLMISAYSPSIVVEGRHKDCICFPCLV